MLLPRSIPPTSAWRPLPGTISRPPFSSISAPASDRASIRASVWADCVAKWSDAGTVGLALICFTHLKLPTTCSPSVFHHPSWVHLRSTAPLYATTALFVGASILGPLRYRTYLANTSLGWPRASEREQRRPSSEARACVWAGFFLGAGFSGSIPHQVSRKYHSSLGMWARMLGLGFGTTLIGAGAGNGLHCLGWQVANRIVRFVT